MFFNNSDVFLPGEYTIEYRASELLLVGFTSTDYGWHNGYDQEALESAGRTGLFKYIDMIPAVEIHMRIARNFIKSIKVSNS